MIRWFSRKLMTEQEFCDAIACKFPYRDPATAYHAMQLGAAISDEALFYVLHEICRPPKGAKVKKGHLHALLLMWTKVSTHALSKQMEGCAKRMIDGRLLSVAEAVSLMREIARYPGQYSALNIAYFSCDDPTAANESIYDAIREAWNPGREYPAP